MNKQPITANTMRTLTPRTLFPLLCLALLGGALNVRAQSGTWTTAGAGNWGDTANWNFGIGPIADGSGNTADFSTIDLTANVVVTLDTPRTIGNLIFGDTVTNTAFGWTLGGSPLTLAGGTVPTITVNTLGGTAVTTFTNVLAGTAGLLKLGSGTLTLAPTVANTINGGVTIGGGTIVLGGSQTLVGQLGMPGGTLTLTNGGWLTMNGYNSGSSTGWGSFTNPVVVPAGQTGGMSVFGRGTFSSTVNVAGTLNLWVSYVRGDFTGNWFGSTGQINVDHASSGGDFRLNSTASALSFGTAAINLATGVVLYEAGNFAAGGQTVTIGAVSGVGFMRGGPTAGRTLTYVVGGRNSDATFAGSIQNGTGLTAVTKQGTGTWTLSSTNIYTGATAVNAGKLVGVTGGCISNTASFTVASGATNGIQVASTGGHWDTTNVTFSAGTTYLEFNFGTVTPSTLTGTSPNGAPMFIRGNLTANNTINVSILGGNWSPGVYPLVKYTGTLSSFAAFNLLTQPLRVTGTLSNDTANSTIDYVVTAANEPLDWATGTGTWDIGTTANWKDASGAGVSYQELAGLGDLVVFEDTLSGTSPIIVSLALTVTPVSVTVNASKDYTISGAGGITGSTGLTKSGSGTLTLSTANAFTGPVNLNGGVTVFSTTANLGAAAAPINFGGGTLQFASGNTTDISARTITLGGGGGTLNDGGNTISFANPIGNNGAGGLTKTGAGTLTLYGTNRYSGNTLVSQGTLALGANAAIPNSPSITVNGSAILDVSASGLVLNGLASQVLAGGGTVNGSVTCGAGTSISPGASPGTLTVGDLTFNGGTYVFDVSTTTRDLIVAANLNLVGGTIQVAASGALTNGVYKLIQYSGSLLSGANSSANLIISGFSQLNKAVALSDAIAGEIDLVVFPGRGTNLVWQGDGVNNYWDEETSFNWTNSLGNPMQFISLDKVVFDDTSPNTSVNLQAAVQPGSVTVNGTQSYTFQTTANGKLAGSGGLTNNSSGTLTVLTTDTRTGPTAINAGTVQVGNGGTTGDLGSGNIINNSALIFAQTDDRSVAGQISGAGSLTQQGSATLSLAQNNALMSGPTTINAGTLQVGNGGATGSLGTSAVTDNATLSFNRSGAFTFGNAVTGSGALVMNGPGTMTLNGVNTYLGNTYISNGVVKLGAAQEIPDGDAVPGSTGWLILDGGATSAGVFDLNGFNQTVNALSGLGGTVVGVISNSASAGTNVLTVGTAAAGAGTTWNGRIVDNPTGAKNALVVRGATTLRMNGNNTYTGGTFVGDTATLVFGPGATVGNGGSITLSNGTTFRMQNAGGTSSFPGNNLILPTGATATVNSTQAGNGYGGLVYGDATTTNVFSGTGSFGTANVKQYQNLLGTVQIPLGSALRFSSTSLTVNGGDNATFELEGTLNTRNGTATGAGISLGALTGTGGTLGGAGNADGNGLYVIGAKNIDCTFSGTVNGTTPRGTSITKVGTGRLTLDGTLSYDRTTTVSNGVLAIASVANPATSLDNSATINVRAGAVLDVSARSDSTLTLGNVAGQVLSGSGTITGSLVVGANSTVNPGDGIGTLTVSSAATLGGLVNMELNRTNTPNADRLAALSVAYGGTLTVTNLGPLLQGGDTFQLLSGTPSGSFAATNLPALAPGLSWDASQLNVNGRLSVAGQIIPPQISGLQVMGTTNVLSGTGGGPGAAFNVLGSTNVALPLASWTVLGNGTFALDGSWGYTNRFATNATQFYIVRE
jgi:fibronectin-binding autotransporter adhesin